MTTTFEDLCLDAADPLVVGRFWAAALGQELRRLDDGAALVTGPRFVDLRIDRVPEPKTVKNRVHPDLYAPDVAPLLDLGATVLMDNGPDEWKVLADPEGNELCAFPGASDGAPATAFAICVDSDRPVELCAWWHAHLGGAIGPGSDGRPRWLHGAAGLGEVILKFVPVDDDRVVRNRCRWDVTTDDLAALVAAGAEVLRAADQQVDWTVLRDPDGNEFCAMTPR